VRCRITAPKVAAMPIRLGVLPSIQVRADEVIE
jgi:hypothetical protein